MGRRRKPMPRSGLVEVVELLEGALKELGAKSDFELFRLRKKCAEVLGEAFARALSDVSFKGGQVSLAFNHSIWLNEMNFRKQELLQKLQQELPELGIKSLHLALARNPRS